MKRITTLFLALIFTVSLVACTTGKDNPGTGTTDRPTGSSAVTSEAASSELRDNLPDDLNFDGAVFRVHYNDQNKSEWLIEDETDKLSAAVYKRNMRVIDRLNVKIDTYNAGPFGEYNSVALPALQDSISSGDGEYSLIAGYQAYITRAGMVDYLYNLNGVKYLDFDMPWWNSEARDNMTVNDKFYYLTGDLAITYLQNMSIVLFNAQIAQDQVSTDLYQTALDGNWTMALFKKSIIEGASDLNSDGVIDDENDQIGLTMFDRGSGVLPFLAAFREYYISKDDNGSFYLDINAERMQTIVESVVDLFWNTEGSVVPSKGYPTAKEKGLAKIANGSCLFMIERLLGVEQPVIRNMESEWGILPIPKLDDNQKEYGVWLTDAYSMFCIPKDVKDIDMACAVTEALAYESYENVTDVYYDTCLKTKYMRSDNAKKIVDMLRSCVQINFGYVYTKTGPLPGFVNELVLKNNTDFASWLAANKGTMENELKYLLEQYGDND